jgi:hypothetical protein
VYIKHVATRKERSGTAPYPREFKATCALGQQSGIQRLQFVTHENSQTWAFEKVVK